MNDDRNIFGCFISYPSLMYDATEQQKEDAKNKGDLFRQYIWGDIGIGKSLESLEYNVYGIDLMKILFQFYVNPLAYESENLKGIESYRKNEKSIGVDIIVNDDNFFKKTEIERFNFLRDSIMERLDLLTEVIRNKKLDTNIEKLKVDTYKVIN